MKKPFYSKHNKKFCVVRTFNGVMPTLTKKDYLLSIFSFVGIPVFTYDMFLTRYKNRFSLSEIKKAHSLAHECDWVFDLPCHFDNDLLDDFCDILKSSAFKDFCEKKVGF